MTSFPRRPRDRPSRRRRGASEALSAVILTTILFGSGVTYVASIIDFSNEENAAVASRLRLDQEQEGERFNVTAVLVDGKLGAHVFNFGALPLQVAYVFVTQDFDGQVVGINNTALLSTPVTANPGAASVDVVTDFVFPEIDSYTVTVVTRRGNLGRDSFPLGDDDAFAKQPNIGFLVIEFDQFQWAQSSNGNNGTWSAWTAGWNVPGNAYTVFRLNVTNQRSQAITIAQQSLFMIFEGLATDTVGFWIMNATVENSANAYTETNMTRRLQNVDNYNTPVTILATEWRWLYFSTASMGDDDPDRFPAPAGSYATALMFYGTWSDGTAYAQTVPFVAVRRA